MSEKQRATTWAAWNRVTGFGDFPSACADIDEARRTAGANTAIDSLPWHAVRVTITKDESRHEH